MIGRHSASLPTVKTAYAIAETFKDAGIVAEALDGTTPMDERRAISSNCTLARPRSCVIAQYSPRALMSRRLIASSWPGRHSARPFYSADDWRGTRIYPGKPDCLILDVVGVSTKRHRLQTVSTLF